MNKTLLAAPFVMGLLFSAAASAVTLDFEGFAHGQVMDDEYEAVRGVQIYATDRAQNEWRKAVIFDTRLPSTDGDGDGDSDPDLKAPFAGNPSSLGPANPGNVLIIQENTNGCGDGICNHPDDHSGGGMLIFQFDSAVAVQSLDIFDTEEAGGKLLFADMKGDVFKSIDIPVIGNGEWQQILFNGGKGIEGVYYFAVKLKGSGAIDNLTYVPVPASVWLFGSALAFLGARRRRAAARLAA